MLLEAVELGPVGLVPVVLLFDVIIAVAVLAVVVAFANILVVPINNHAASLIVTGIAVG